LIKLLIDPLWVESHKAYAIAQQSAFSGGTGTILQKIWKSITGEHQSFNHRWPMFGSQWAE
jgi:hypothetical protein